MINITELSPNPLRQGMADACLLSSFAAALYPFTLTKEIQYFVDCCNLLGATLKNQEDAIYMLCPQLNDLRIGTKLSRSGYDWLEELFNNCPGASFTRAKTQVIIKRGLLREEVEKCLNDDQCTSVFALHFPKGSHSICIIKDATLGFIARDSAQPTRMPEPIFDASGSSLDELIINLYRRNDVQIGESILIYPK